ncbi:hypothetical protein ACYF6T_43580 [Streptomyces sp. 7R007]
MNRRPTLLAAIALTATAALSLSACGSDDNSKGKDADKIAGADTGKEVSASPTVPTSTQADRPNIELPSDLTYAFDWPKTGDANKDAVLSDSEQLIKAVDMAIADQDALSKAYRYYSEGEAAAGSQEFVQDFVDHKNRVTGVKHYFNARVDLNGDGTAGLVYCEDQTKAYNKSIKTGKVTVTQPSEDDYVLYASRLKVNKQGVWITETLSSQRGNAACQS